MATRTDWEEEALAEIAASGLRSLSIPALARSLGVTKGSFYWHFESLDHLIEASLRKWEELDSEALDELRRVAEPRLRLIALFVDAMEKRQAHALYVALSASDAPNVAAALRRINERRLRFLLDAYRELGFTPADARERSMLAYAAYIGALHLRNQRSSGLRKNKDVSVFVAHAVETLIPATRHPERSEGSQSAKRPRA